MVLWVLGTSEVSSVAAEGLDKNSYVVYSSMMRNRSDKRMFMFFHPDESSPDKPISVRTLVDFEPQATEAK